MRSSHRGPLVALVPLAVLAACAGPESAPPPRASQAAAAETASPRRLGVDPHAWLRRMVGDWTVENEARMAPGAEPMTASGTERVRALGDLWIVAEGRVEFQGSTVETRLTLGHDPERVHDGLAGAFVGSWVDTLQPYQWTYVGELDPSKDALTLFTEGPSLADPRDVARYRETIRLEGSDRRVFTSSVETPDGGWFEFARSEYQRVPAGGPEEGG